MTESTLEELFKLYQKYVHAETRKRLAEASLLTESLQQVRLSQMSLPQFFSAPSIAGVLPPVLP